MKLFNLVLQAASGIFLSLAAYSGTAQEASYPARIVITLEAALADARQSREFIELTETRGTDIFAQDGKQLAATVEQELALNKTLLKSVAPN